MPATGHACQHATQWPWFVFSYSTDEDEVLQGHAMQAWKAAVSFTGQHELLASFSTYKKNKQKMFQQSPNQIKTHTWTERPLSLHPVLQASHR